MIQVGERTGRLETILRQLAVYLEKEEAIGNKVKSAMIYPVVILCLSVGVVLLLVTVALPAMLGLFVEMKVELPWTTRLLLAVTYFFRDHGTAVFIGALVVVALLAAYTQMPAGRWQVHFLTLKMPIIGGINVKGGPGAHRPHHVDSPPRGPASGRGHGPGPPDHRELGDGAALWQPCATSCSPAAGCRGRWAGSASSQGFWCRWSVWARRPARWTATWRRWPTFTRRRPTGQSRNLTSLLEPMMLIFAGGVVAFIAVSVIMPMYAIMGTVR